MAKKNYVDNEKFHKELVEYLRIRKERESKGEEAPVMPDYIGVCIQDIATRLSRSGNFINYPFREDMIMDGIETCIKYIHNFDPERKNPFAYFTTIIYYAFLTRIKKEKKELYVKQKVLQNTYFEGLLADQEIDDLDYNINVDLDNPYMNELMETIDKKREDNAEKRRNQRPIKNRKHKTKEEPVDENSNTISDYYSTGDDLE